MNSAKLKVANDFTSRATSGEFYSPNSVAGSTDPASLSALECRGCDAREVAQNEGLQPEPASGMPSAATGS